MYILITLSVCSFYAADWNQHKIFGVRAKLGETEPSHYAYLIFVQKKTQNLYHKKIVKIPAPEPQSWKF